MNADRQEATGSSHTPPVQVRLFLESIVQTLPLRIGLAGTLATSHRHASWTRRLVPQLLLKDEQRLSKLHWEHSTAIYKKHILAQEAIAMAGPMTWEGGVSATAQKKAVLTLRKPLMLKEQQKLAKQNWELACCKTKQEMLEEGPATSSDDSEHA